VVEVEAGGPVEARLARVLVGALPLQFAFGLVYAWGAVAPYVERDLHWSPLLVTAVFSATPVGYGTGIVTGGWLADRFPPRRLCWAGLGLLAIGLSVALTYPSGPTFVLLYSMLGLGLGGGLALAGSVAAGRHVLPERAGAYALAAPVQVPLVSVLAAAHGWLPALRGLAAALLLLAATTLAVMPAVPKPWVHAEHRGHPPLSRLLRRPQLLTAILLEVTCTPLGAYAFVHAAGYARSLGLAAAVATAAVTAVAVGNAVGRIGGGALSDRVGVDLVVSVALLADLLAAGVLFLHPGLFALVAATLLTGIGFGVPAGVIGRLAASSAPDAPNSAFGLLFAGFAIGAGPGSLLGAAVAGSAGWLATGGLALPGLLVIGWRLRLGRQVGVLTEDQEDHRQQQS
jgi:predicted MFS family arabinose efflux permease